MSGFTVGIYETVVQCNLENTKYSVYFRSSGICMLVPCIVIQMLHYFRKITINVSETYAE